MINPNIKNIESRNNKKITLASDAFEFIEKQPQFSSVPFRAFIPIKIMKTKSREDKTKADCRTNSPITKKVPRKSSNQGRK